MEDQASAASMLSWNTHLSRTSVSSLSCAVFSGKQTQAAHGLGDVIKHVRALNLRRYRLEDFSREEVLGEGESYVVQRCVARDGGVFAVKHVKVGDQVDRKLFQRRLRSVILELQIMRHPPFKAHPNITSALGYGWGTQGGAIIPFIVVEHASIGTFRQHVKCAQRSLADIEILAGDVAAGLAALHICGIIHGDMKLDNVLIFPSSDRPSKSLAKLTDFGHALVLNDTSKGRGVYAGTSMYNAPEVQDQADCPIDPAFLSRCDLWAFGLLVWEACTMGAEYPQGLDPSTLFLAAKQDIRGPNWGAPFFLRIAVHKCLQADPTMRPTDARSLPLYTRWNTSNTSSLQAKLALHIEAPMPTYEIFRLDNDRDISWAHQQQIFESLVQAFQDKLAQEVSSVTWQIALCHHIGFGTARDQAKADEFAGIAKIDDYPVATCFAHLLAPDGLATNPDANFYTRQVVALLQYDTKSFAEMPSIVGAFHSGDGELASRLFSEGAYLGESTVDGCSPLHWLFMFQDQQALDGVVDMLRKLKSSHLAALLNLPFSAPREVHAQWPLQLLGTPLAVAISVNSLRTVKALLKLGADPFLPVYHETQLPSGDLRLGWTAFHVAARYHCSDILRHLIEHSNHQQRDFPSPLGCALSFSTSLERLAMHGQEHEKNLNETIRLVRDIQPLACVDPNGMTALMKAIDFQDRDVTAALLQAHPELAATPFGSPRDRQVFTLPIHFAAQIASQRDLQDTLDIPELINSYTRQLSSETDPPRDHAGRTPLHLAATGGSRLVAKWILERRPGLLHVEDDQGRTPLHYCTSAGICELLLDQGANVDHADELGMTTLHRVCLNGAAELIPALLKYRPTLDLRNNKFGTPLHCAVISGSVDTVLALVEARAPLDATDLMGNTAAHVAAKLDRHQILRLLSRKGANTTLKNVNGHDPRRIALDEGRHGSVGILRILQPSWEATTQQILNVEATTQQTLNVDSTARSRERPVPGEDFLWKRDEVMGHVDGEMAAGQEGDGADKVEDGRVEHEDTVMQSVLQTLIRIGDSRQRRWRGLAEERFIDSLIESSMTLVDGSIWQSDLATRATEIITRTAHDLALSLSSSFFIDTESLSSSWVLEGEAVVDGGQSNEDEAEDSSGDDDGSENGRDDDEDSSHEVDASSSLAAPRFAACPCGADQMHWQLLIIMVQHVATVVMASRPRGVFPGREVHDLRNMMFCELLRLRFGEVDGEEHTAQATMTLFRESHHFLRPWLGRPLDRFEQWRRRQAGSNTANGSSQNQNESRDTIWREQQQWRKAFLRRQQGDSSDSMAATNTEDGTEDDT